jgi:hypothetical protein
MRPRWDFFWGSPYNAIHSMAGGQSRRKVTDYLF